MFASMRPSPSSLSSPQRHARPSHQPLTAINDRPKDRPTCTMYTCRSLIEETSRQIYMYIVHVYVYLSRRFFAFARGASVASPRPRRCLLHPRRPPLLLTWATEEVHVGTATFLVNKRRDLCESRTRRMNAKATWLLGPRSISQPPKTPRDTEYYKKGKLR